MDESEDKTPPEGTRLPPAESARPSAESHALADVSAALATAADQLRAAARGYDGLTGTARQLERAKLAATLDRVAIGTRAAATAFASGERVVMDLKTVPWKRIALVAAGGACAAVAAIVPETLTVLGLHLQHLLIAAAGALAGWAKRAPGDIKGE